MPAAAPVPEASGDLWPGIRGAVIPMLPLDIRFTMEDESRIRGSVEGNQILLEAQTSFLVTRLQKQDVVQNLMEAGRKVCGKEMRVQVREFRAEEPPKRSLDDLRQFKEVRFVHE